MKEKIMRRMTLWSMICLGLVLMLATASAQPITITEAVGRWYFIEVNGTGMPEGSYVEFNRDTSVTLVANGNAVETTGYTWKIAKEELQIHTPQKSYYSVEYDGMYLTARIDSLASILGYTNTNYIDSVKLSRNPISYNTPDMVLAEKEDQFFGSFAQYLVVQNDQYTAIDEDEHNITIAKYVLSDIQKDIKSDYLTDFSDGLLRVYLESTEWVFSVTSDPDVLVGYPAGDENVTYYYFLRQET